MAILGMLFAMTSCTRPPLPNPIVLFDEYHAGSSLVADTTVNGLNQLGQLFVAQGFQIFTSKSPLTSEGLKSVSVLIIALPVQNFSYQEIQAIINYLDQGGQLIVLLDDAFPAANLLASLGVMVSNNLVRERQHLPSPDIPYNFINTEFPNHPLTKDLKHILFFGSWALNTQFEANVIAKTSNEAWIDLNNNDTLDNRDARQSFSVIVTGQRGHGHYVVFGDGDVFRNLRINMGNLQLAKNLAGWMKAGSYYNRY